MLVGAGTFTHAVAQDATPAPGAHEYPFTPDPASCTAEPRDTEALLDIWFPTDGTPVAEEAVAEEPPTEVTIPVGQLADQEVADEVATTVHGLLSCFAAGDFPRALSFFTDNLARSYSPGPDETREDVTAFLEATPMADPDSDQGQILAITDVMLLDDGRVGAFVVDSSAEGTFTVYAIFEEQEDGRLLVDKVIAFSPDEESGGAGGGAGGVSSPGDD